MINIRGKNAFITGSSRGIGQQIALGLAKLGCHIIVHGRKHDSCIKTLKLIEPYDVNTYSVFGEISYEKQVSQIIKQVQELNINVDILYNNAAIMTTYHEDIWTHSEDEWLETF